jgi:hypothetical protein
VKFSTMTSRQPHQSSRPVALAERRPFLFVLRPEKIGDFPHHWSSVIDARDHGPSGRRVDSMDDLGAQHGQVCVQDGPAQVVMSARRVSPPKT